MARREATARLDMRYATAAWLLWLSSVKFGASRRDYRTSVWNGQGYTVRSAAGDEPAVVVPRAALNSNQTNGRRISAEILAHAPILPADRAWYHQHPPFLLQMNTMPSQKLSKILILGAMAAVALSVVGYVFVVVADYTDCERIEAAELKKGNKVSCRDVKAGMAAE